MRSLSDSLKNRTNIVNESIFNYEWEPVWPSSINKDKYDSIGKDVESNIKNYFPKDIQKYVYINAVYSIRFSKENRSFGSTLSLDLRDGTFNGSTYDGSTRGGDGVYIGKCLGFITKDFNKIVNDLRKIVDATFAKYA